MSEGEGVNLLSIHASKGLEFKEVYVIDLMDGRFPNRKLMQKAEALKKSVVYFMLQQHVQKICFTSLMPNTIKLEDFLHAFSIFS